MKNSIIHVILVLSLTLAAGAARAANPLYAVEARAMTGTMPGAGATYVGPLQLEVSAHALHDPPALQWIFNVSQILFSDAIAETWTDIGSLTTHAFARAERIKATNFPPGVTAQTYANYLDHITVTSDTLPIGTPVTVTFANTMTVDWQGTGQYDGKATCLLQMGGLNTRSQFSAAYNKPVVELAGAPLVIHTTVGNSFNLTGRLDTSARGWFFVPGPLYDGQMTLDATCDTSLVSVTSGVELVADSGVDYAAL